MGEKDYIFVKHLSKVLTKVYFNDITFIKSDRDYCRVFTSNSSYYLYCTMQKIVTMLPSKIFCRCHRGYMVNMNKIESIKENIITIEQNDIKIGGIYKKAFFDRLNILNKKIERGSHNYTSEDITSKDIIKKLKNKLALHYSLADMILQLHEEPELKSLVIEQAKQMQKSKKIINELLKEIESVDGSRHKKQIPCYSIISKDNEEIFSCNEKIPSRVAI